MCPRKLQGSAINTAEGFIFFTKVSISFSTPKPRSSARSNLKPSAPYFSNRALRLSVISLSAIGDFARMSFPQPLKFIKLPSEEVSK